jgi:hypothetical protein
LADAALHLLPTPTTSDTNGAGTHGTGGPDLRTTISLLPTPTPTARDGKGPNQRNDATCLHGALIGPAALLPTPTVNGNNNARGMSPTSQNGLTTVLRALSTGESTSPESEAGNTP